jgi:hypothetical protein
VALPPSARRVRPRPLDWASPRGAHGARGSEPGTTASRRLLSLCAVAEWRTEGRLLYGFVDAFVTVALVFVLSSIGTFFASREIATASEDLLGNALPADARQDRAAPPGRRRGSWPHAPSSTRRYGRRWRRRTTRGSGSCSNTRCSRASRRSMRRSPGCRRRWRRSPRTAHMAAPPSRRGPVRCSSDRLSGLLRAVHSRCSQEPLTRHMLQHA